MNTLIVYCHPAGQSHCRRILDAVVRGLRGAGVAHEVVDLYACGFDPRLSATAYERMFVSRDRTAEPDVAAMQAKVAAARNLVFIYPVWWYGMPAALKGFLDRVFSAGFAYRFRPYTRLAGAAAAAASALPGLRRLLQPHAAIPLLRGKRALVFRTYGGPPAGRRIFGNTTAGLEDVVLRFCGITDIAIRELYGLHLPADSEARERRFLRRAEDIAARIRND